MNDKIDLVADHFNKLMTDEGLEKLRLERLFEYDSKVAGIYNVIAQLRHKYIERQEAVIKSKRAEIESIVKEKYEKYATDIDAYRSIRSMPRGYSGMLYPNTNITYEQVSFEIATRLNEYFVGEDWANFTPDILHSSILMKVCGDVCEKNRALRRMKTRVASLYEENKMVSAESEKFEDPKTAYPIIRQEKTAEYEKTVRSMESTLSAKQRERDRLLFTINDYRNELSNFENKYGEFAQEQTRKGAVR